MKEDGNKRLKLFSILMAHFSYWEIFKNIEERELISDVNYVSVSVVKSDVKVFVVSFLISFSQFFWKQTYCHARMLDWSKRFET